MERKHEKYQRLIGRCKSLEPVACAVVHPCDEKLPCAPQLRRLRKGSSSLS